jgi:hypothetical protein
LLVLSLLLLLLWVLLLWFLCSVEFEDRHEDFNDWWENLRWSSTDCSEGVVDDTVDCVASWGCRLEGIGIAVGIATGVSGVCRQSGASYWWFFVINRMKETLKAIIVWASISVLIVITLCPKLLVLCGTRRSSQQDKKRSPFRAELSRKVLKRRKKEIWKDLLRRSLLRGTVTQWPAFQTPHWTHSGHSIRAQLNFGHSLIPAWQSRSSIEVSQKVGGQGTRDSHWRWCWCCRYQDSNALNSGGFSQFCAVT